MQEIQTHQLDTLGRRWANEERKVRTLTDALGNDMDASITPAVVALRLLGFHTIASCGGHLDRHTGGPYVLIEVPEAATLAQKAQKIDDENPDYLVLRHQADLARATALRRVCDWLRAFYDERAVDHDNRIVAHSMPWFLILMEPSSDLILTMDRSEARRFLNANRREFEDFASFVRSRTQVAA